MSKSVSKSVSKTTLEWHHCQVLTVSAKGWVSHCTEQFWWPGIADVVRPGDALSVLYNVHKRGKTAWAVRVGSTTIEDKRRYELRPPARAYRVQPA